MLNSGLELEMGTRSRESGTQKSDLGMLNPEADTGIWNLDDYCKSSLESDPRCVGPDV